MHQAELIRVVVVAAVLLRSAVMVRLELLALVEQDHQLIHLGALQLQLAKM